ncbi:hypothetical protein RRG08_014933 [Elysia crispata]|uniref:Uncharacterized protein n=1 Tax=Elysia crispata TaxID=231223 RepID=A0AAE1B126_9GAST|nr:hypothetical protein RRG08_014933 [Elysia crispata]
MAEWVFRLSGGLRLDPVPELRMSGRAGRHWSKTDTRGASRGVWGHSHRDCHASSFLGAGVNNGVVAEFGSCRSISENFKCHERFRKLHSHKTTLS